MIHLFQPATLEGQALSNQPVVLSQRLLSLDFTRGLIMVLLMLEAAGLYDHLLKASTEGGLWQAFLIQFTHHPWHGCVSGT